MTPSPENQKEPIHSLVDQSGATAGGDIVGRDRITNQLERRRTQIEVWMRKLADEMREDARAQETIDSLQYFQKKYSVDGIEGLEAKLNHAGRPDQCGKAIRQKEHFSKLLARYSLYGSAQEIFAYLLSKGDSLFESEVFPHVGELGVAELDKLTMTKVVEPVLSEFGDGQFIFNYNHASGMIFWLAEQCFVRWHK